MVDPSQGSRFEITAGGSGTDPDDATGALDGGVGRGAGTTAGTADPSGGVEGPRAPGSPVGVDRDADAGSSWPWGRISSIAVAALLLAAVIRLHHLHATGRLHPTGP